ncbi:dTDP-4-dehydrorhamnose reductase [Alicyclobacillus ferrooxydans]|uniref:dTDP-4-dehydrorhamnose reductase n=1 Tax=Alicyclobacillus ferrooxydans TaxID=471514 RepID=A0A0P9CIH2_9BACL|nr:dTDP-4-dehydrorhamnose reductase [Alicyclobacillus ferrooxydans]KPV45227.1 dTDP-4-dehydrorhamnose reductase [Alicyclobacillus ferrooxydans]
MKVLVTGANGQLGRDVLSLFSASHDVYGFSHSELDITNAKQTASIIDAVTPDVIIHTAAYTAVDKAEESPEQAYLVNAEGTRNVALAADKVRAKLCAISTDYVFDGDTEHPYCESDTPNPRNVYGATKLAGEHFIQECTNSYFIVRTSWVFGIHGNNFVKTMLRLGQGGKSIRVVNDQFGCPTYTKDLAQFLLELIGSNKFGIYHATNTGQCSWYEFAKEIFTQASLTVDLSPCSTEEFPRPARRPKYSVLAHSEIERNGFNDLPTWQDALERFLRECQPNSMSEVRGQ